MIEIMCRDGSLSIEQLEQAAQIIEETIGCQVDVLDIDDYRGMVYWGLADVEQILREEGVANADDAELCADLLRAYEPDIHTAMLEAGKEALQNGIEEFLNDTMDEDEEDESDKDNEEFSK